MAWEYNDSYTIYILNDYEELSYIQKTWESESKLISKTFYVRELNTAIKYPK